MLGLAIIILELLAITGGPLLISYDPIEAAVNNRFQSPSLDHPFGTDELGRDILTRVLYGGRISIGVGVSSVFICMLAAVPLGLVSGYVGGRTDETAMRFIDILLTFPGILLAIVIAATLGPSAWNVIFAVAIFHIPIFARVTRAETLSIKEKSYIEAAHAVGARDMRIMFKHILPNMTGPILVLMSLSVGTAILSATALNFIGLGGQPPTPEWGLMLSSGRDYLRNEWWVATFPGLIILVTALGVNLLGDGLRDVLDPRIRTSKG